MENTDYSGTKSFSCALLNLRVVDLSGGLKQKMLCSEAVMNS